MIHRGGRLVDEGFAPAVVAWWAVMSGIGLLNIGLWIAFGFRRRRRTPRDRDWAAYWRWQWYLSGLYVLGCASRCFVLRSDVNRYALIDSWIASVAVGRSVATVAELAFVAQWTVLLLLFARASRADFAARCAWPIVPLIVLAEFASWYGVLTTNYLGHAIEESLWALSAALMVLGLWHCRPRVPIAFKRPINAGLFCGLTYILYMVTIDIPTYVHAWTRDQAASKVYLTLSEGLVDIQRVVVTGRTEDWQYPMVWMTLYFSLAVWMSLAMVRWPEEVDLPASESEHEA